MLLAEFDQTLYHTLLYLDQRGYEHQVPKGRILLVKILTFPTSLTPRIFRPLPPKTESMSLLEDFLPNPTTPLSYTHLKKPGLKDCGTMSYAGRKPESLVICSNERRRSLYQENPGGDNQ
jgi:hypothetical protein